MGTGAAQVLRSTRTWLWITVALFALGSLLGNAWNSEFCDERWHKQLAGVLLVFGALACVIGAVTLGMQAAAETSWRAWRACGVVGLLIVASFILSTSIPVLNPYCGD
jgi:hypothetical protein